MSLAEKLQQRAKELDAQIIVAPEYYSLKKADDRDLLEAAAKRIRELEHSLWLI